MRSAFFELNVANSGLFATQAGLSVAAHNIANRNTEGYSRQVSLQRADRPLSLGTGYGMIGTGSVAYGIGQIRNTYLDNKYWNANSSHGTNMAKTEQYRVLENTFLETDDTGFNASIDGLFKSIQQLTESAGDMSYRTNVIQSAKTLTQYFNDTAAALVNQQKDINSEVKITVEQINNIGRQIQGLNRQIYVSEMDGSNANDLRDRRALLVDKLSEYVNVEVKEINLSGPNNPNDKRFTVSINGYDFINHYDMNELEVRERTVKNNAGDAEGLYDVYWAKSGIKFNSKFSMNTMSGTLKGLLDVRDGNNQVGGAPVDGKGIPYYMERLNVFARTIARLFNDGTDLAGNSIDGVTGHKDAYSLDDYPNNTGLNFFSYYTDEASKNVYDGYSSIDYSKITAANFTVSKELIENSSKLAAANSQNPDKSDNEWALGILSAKHNNKVFDVGEIGNYIEAVIGELAVDTSYAVSFEKKYTDAVSIINNQRISVSGVDENEEMTRIIELQQSYQALAKLVNVINSIYDTLINRLI